MHLFSFFLIFPRSILLERILKRTFNLKLLSFVCYRSATVVEVRLTIMVARSTVIMRKAVPMANMNSNLNIMKERWTEVKIWKVAIVNNHSTRITMKTMEMVASR